MTKIPTERGPAYDLSQSYSISANYPRGAGADWFGPLAPVQPVAPPEVAGRALDFLPGYNLTTQPRYSEPIDFATLRALADAYDPLRLVIERRKDQMCRLPWTIRAKHEGRGKRPKAAALPTSTRERIKDIEAFFKTPDFEVTFRGWLRTLLEDLFVIDAPSLYCERSFGQLVGLRVVDGATIKRVIDDWGRTPRPLRWTGAPFMWNGQQIDSDNYAALGFKVDGGLIYPVAYQQVLKGLPATSLTTRDLYYRPNNLRPSRLYGFSPVEQVITTVNIAIRRAFHQLEYYREGNAPEGFYSLPSSWTPDQVQRFQDYFDNLQSGHLGQRRRLKFMAGEKGAYQAVREPPLKNEFDEWLVRIVCFAFSYPVSAFVSQVNRATAEQHEAQAEKEGLEPIKTWAADLLNEVIERDFNTDEIEFAWIEEDEIDPKKQAEILSTYVDCGGITINELRERIGEEPSADPAANVLAVKTPTGRVPISTAAESKASQQVEEEQ